MFPRSLLGFDALRDVCELLLRDNQLLEDAVLDWSRKYDVSATEAVRRVFGILIDRQPRFFGVIFQHQVRLVTQEWKSWGDAASRLLFLVSLPSSSLRVYSRSML